MSTESILESRIRESKKVFGDKFDYSEYEYLGSKEKSIVVCPIHGRIECLIYAHSRSKHGCAKCATLVNKSLFNAKYFREHLPSVVKERYDFSNFDADSPDAVSAIKCILTGEVLMLSATEFVTTTFHSRKVSASGLKPVSYPVDSLILNWGGKIRVCNLKSIASFFRSVGSLFRFKK